MTKWRFLIGWLDSSDGNCGEPNGLHSEHDLTEETAGFCVDFELHNIANSQTAWLVGAGYAFLEDWTLTDSVSRIIKLEGNCNDG